MSKFGSLIQFKVCKIKISEEKWAIIQYGNEKVKLLFSKLFQKQCGLKFDYQIEKMSFCIQN